MLNSAEHEILNAHKNKNIKNKYQEIQLFPGSDKSIMLFFLRINAKMPTTIVCILLFMSRKIFLGSAELSMKRFLRPQG